MKRGFIVFMVALSMVILLSPCTYPSGCQPDCVNHYGCTTSNRRHFENSDKSTGQSLRLSAPIAARIGTMHRHFLIV